MRLSRFAFCILAFGGTVFACSSDDTDEDERICGSDLDCREGQFCAYPDATCGTVGTCANRPDVCTEIYDPVCGCDGFTYSSRCVAQAAGVNVAHTDECVGAPACDDMGTDCPGVGTCVDDPRDNCEPAQGDEDCLGMCACGSRVGCDEGEHWDSSPFACGCVPDEDPCSAVTCAEQTECVIWRTHAVCRPVSGAACGSVSCGPGLECCNDSCGICTPPDGACILIECA